MENNLVVSIELAGIEAMDSTQMFPTLETWKHMSYMILEYLAVLLLLEPKCLPTGEWLKQYIEFHKEEYYSDPQNNVWQLPYVHFR